MTGDDDNFFMMVVHSGLWVGQGNTMLRALLKLDLSLSSTLAAAQIRLYPNLPGTYYIGP